MPIRPENRDRYPENWPEIRESILKRAGYRCERCGVAQYAVGHRDASGRFVGIRGNIYADLAGNGRSYPSCARLTYAEARQWADESNAAQWFDDDRRLIVIVLTIAHIDDPSPENCDPSNLLALCQRCHNQHDAAERAAGRRRRKAEAEAEATSKRQPSLF